MDAEEYREENSEANVLGMSHKFLENDSLFRPGGNSSNKWQPIQFDSARDSLDGMDPNLR